MDRINGAGHVNRRFVMENVAAGRPPTEITNSWLNAVQEEIVNVILAAGIVLDPASENQLATAIAELISDGSVVYATVAEIATGTESARAIHPAGLKAFLTALGYAKKGAANEWTAAQAPVVLGLADGATVTWDCAIAQVAKLAPAGNRVMGAPSNVLEGAMYLLRATQDATGSRTLTWNAAYKFGGAGAPTLTTTAAKTDFLSFVGGTGNTLEFVGARLNGV